MTKPYRVELLQEILSDIRERVQGIDWAVIVSLDGFVVASHPPADNETPGFIGYSPTVAATAANAIALGEGALERVHHGQLYRLIIEGEKGGMIIYPVDGTDAALVAMVSLNTKIGLASMVIKKSTADIAAILMGGNQTESSYQG